MLPSLTLCFTALILPLCECKLKNIKQEGPGDVAKVDVRGEFPNCKYDALNFASEFLPVRLRVPLIVHRDLA